MSFMAMVYLARYLSNSLAMLTFTQLSPRIQVYHLYVDKLRILDKGYGTAWQIRIPSFPVAGPSGPSTPSPKKRKERDDAADNTFEAFDAVTRKKN
jgi:hypothetical protein